MLSLLPLRAVRADGAVVFEEAFAGGDRDGWGDQWQLDGVGNLLVRAGQGRLQGGTRIAPADGRVTAFARDARVADATITADIVRTGLLAGLVLRRVGPRHQYQAVLGSGGRGLKLVRRTPEGGEVDLAATQVGALAFPCVVGFTVRGSDPARLEVVVTDAVGREVTLGAADATPALAGAGDPGVLATPEVVSRGVWLAEGELGGAELVPARAAVEELSTAEFSRISVTSTETPRPTVPTVLAAFAGVPVDGGSHLRIVTDVPSMIEVEVSAQPDFTGSSVVALGATNRRNAVVASVAAGEPGAVLHWRARATGTAGAVSTGPVRSFRTLPPRGAPDPVTIAVGSCAEEIGPTFAAIAAESPDVFVWEGDLLYPDYVGPLAQTPSGYAGWWKALLASPALAPVIAGRCFATQRDDHDYGGNNGAAGAAAYTIEPYESILHPQPYYAFGGGLLDVWVLDQRRWRSPADAPDTADKTLLGAEQRNWLYDGLATSRAPFKLVCSPDPLFYPTNRDTNWGKSYTAERDLLLAHIAEEVGGRTVFVTGDTHSAAVVERGGVLEVRASPMHTTNHQASSGDGVVFSETGRFFCLVRASGAGLEVNLIRDDGSRAWSTTFD